MNCIWPTAWSHDGSPCQAVLSGVAAMAAKPPLPSSAGPRIGDDEWPSASSVRPPMVPCCDSTHPIPARVVQPTPQLSGAISIARA